jgi:hypothetical protein
MSFLALGLIKFQTKSEKRNFDKIEEKKGLLYGKLGLD